MKDWEKEINEGRVPHGMGIHMVMTAGFLLMWPVATIYIIWFR